MSWAEAMCSPLMSFKKEGAGRCGDVWKAMARRVEVVKTPGHDAGMQH